MSDSAVAAGGEPAEAQRVLAGTDGAGRSLAERPLVPDGVVPEAVVVDRGKIFVGQHLLATTEALGISVHLCRPYTPTDKAPIERFFRTLRESLLQELPGYKGPDVYSRGLDVVGRERILFLDEFEDVCREWIHVHYHQSPHEGLALADLPGIELSPNEMYDLGIAKRGFMRVPARPDVVFGFLEVQWRTIQHYGVELDGLRYNGPALDSHRNAKSPYGGAQRGKWPFRRDPRDVRRLYFQEPDDHSWHELWWVYAEHTPQPFSAEVLAFARRLALADDRFEGVHDALPSLLRSWEQRRFGSAGERKAAMHAGKGLSELVAGVVTPTVPTPARPGNPLAGAVLGDDDEDVDADDGRLSDALDDDDDYYAGGLDLLR